MRVPRHAPIWVMADELLAVLATGDDALDGELRTRLAYRLLVGRFRNRTATILSLTGPARLE
jgi:hypothetical protein